jgi:hypothetical protein
MMNNFINNFYLPFSSDYFITIEVDCLLLNPDCFTCPLVLNEKIRIAAFFLPIVRNNVMIIRILGIILIVIKNRINVCYYYCFSC